jgi:hypothetical protein
MIKCLIGASGLGDYWDYGIYSVKSEKDASELAWFLACEQYEYYIGMHGIRDVSDIMEEEECDQENAYEIFKEDREMWIDYWYTFDIETKIQELLEEGLINSVTEIANHE